MVSRRDALQHAVGLLSAVGLAGCSRVLDGRQRPQSLGLPPNPRAGSLPERQHAWTDVLRTDGNGNSLAPQYHTVLLLELDDEPSVEAARTVERAMRTVEAAFEWSPDGLLHQLAWGTQYFSRLGALDESPIRRPTVLSRTDDPALLDFDAALVLASDVQSTLSSVEGAMFGRRQSLGGVAVDARLGDVFSLVGRRTGFVGAGLPRQHTHVEGIPDGAPLSSDDPMFMGFFSGMKKTQASEDRVTVQSGRFEGGTTMHLSHLRQSLGDWWDRLDDAGRVARMFSPEFSPEDQAGFTTDVPFSDAVREHARGHGVVGHHEKVARARRDGKPLVLRRDFNTVDGGHAGVHFLALQRTLDDFEKTRRAMNGWYLRDDHERVGDRRNNGILEFITVRSRANFYVPPRPKRSFPLLDE